MKTSIFSLILLALVIGLQSCCGDNQIDPAGEITTKERSISAFKRVYIADGFELILTQEDTPKLLIEANQNVHDYIITEVIGGEELQIRTKDKVEFTTQVHVKVHLSYSQFRSIFSTGGGKISIVGNWKANDFDCTLMGGGSMNCNFQVRNELNLSLSGGSEAALEGYVNKLNMLSSGGSNSYFYELQTDSTTVSISGGGNAQLNVKHLLKVKEASGGSKITYKGNPKLDLKNPPSGGATVDKVD